MTRVCMDCGAVLGEKCPGCGREARLVGELYVCTNGVCRLRYFTKGNGGETHGLCVSCHATRQAANGVTPSPVLVMPTTKAGDL